MEGLDLDVSQTPPQEWSPPNVRFREFDIYTPLQEDMIKQYDVVSIRLLPRLRCEVW